MSKDLAPGVALISPSTLSPEFRRFRNDMLYFISNVMFTPSSVDVAPGSQKKNLARILAATPQALFVCDADGQMDRALKLESIEGLVWQKRVVKKMFSSEEQVTFCIKCPSEFDVVCTLEGNKDPNNITILRNLIKVLEVIVPFKKRARATQGNSGFTARELQANENFESLVNHEAPRDYMSPKDIIAQNAARQKAVQLAEALSVESAGLEDKISWLHQHTEKLRDQLGDLESAMSGDFPKYRALREQRLREHQQTHKEQVNLEVELMRLQTLVKSETERLNEERANADLLVREALPKAGEVTDKELDEAEALRKRANARELEKAQKHIKELKEILSRRPEYVGPEHIVSKALDLESRIDAAMAKWEKEMETSNKLEGFFDAAISDLNLLNEQIAVLVERKTTALKERELKQKALLKQESGQPDDDLFGGPAPATAPDNDDPLFASPAPGVDDDLLGGPAPAVAPKAEDDDLLGGPAPPAVPADDDLLGGPAPPAPAAPADDDLLGGPAVPPHQEDLAL